MSGVLNAMAGASSAASFSITPASTGTGSGYRSSGTGSLSPTSFKGVTIERIETTIEPAQFLVRLAGVVSQSLFHAASVVGGAGDPGRFLSASATYSNPGGTSSQWRWTQTQAGASPDVLADAVVRSVLFQY